MVKSDHSEAEDGGDMSPLEMSSDSMETITKKRPRPIDFENQDEQDLPAKKRQSSFSEKSDILKQDNAEVITDKNGTDKYNMKKEKYTENLDEKSLSDSNIDNENERKQEDNLLKQKNEYESPLDKDNSIMDESSIEKKVKEKIEENKVIIHNLINLKLIKVLCFDEKK